MSLFISSDFGTVTAIHPLKSVQPMNMYGCMLVRTACLILNFLQQIRFYSVCENEWLGELYICRRGQPLFRERDCFFVSTERLFFPGVLL